MLSKACMYKLGAEGMIVKHGGDINTYETEA